MNITIKKRQVPQTSRNGRIYPLTRGAVTSIASSSSSGSGGTGEASLWKRIVTLITTFVSGDSLAVGDLEGDYILLSGTGGIELKGMATIKAKDSAGATGNVLKSNGNGDQPEWVDPSELISGRVKALFKQTENKIINNSVTETSVFATGSGSRTIPANSLAAGDTFRIRLQGIISTASGTESVTIKVKYGSTVLLTRTGTIYEPLSNTMLQIDMYVTTRSIGATGAMLPAGSGYFGTSTILALAATSDIPVDTTSSNVVEVTATWGSAKIANTLTIHIATLELL